MSGIAIECVWHWTCWDCRDPEDPNVPGAYGIEDSKAEARDAADDHWFAHHARWVS